MSLRIVTQFKLAGTRGYRLAASQLFGEFGMNMQNPDKHTLDIAEAPPGYSIIQADQAGAEALVVAYLARPGRYRALFQNGIKPHTYLAMHIFADNWEFPEPGREWWLHAEASEIAANANWKALNNTIKSHDVRYYIGKKTAHSKAYKMGWRTFRLSVLKESGGALVLTQQQAQDFLAMYERLFPEIIEWQGEVELALRSDRVLYNLQGFPRTFERQIDDGYVREAIATIPQSTVGCLTHDAAVATYEFILANGCDWVVCNNKHDSYATIAPDAEALEVARHMRDQLAQTFTGRDGVKFTMGSEVSVGKNWKPAKQRKDGTWINPDGMKEVKL